MRILALFVKAPNSTGLVENVDNAKSRRTRRNKRKFKRNSKNKSENNWKPQFQSTFKLKKAKNTLKDKLSKSVKITSQNTTDSFVTAVMSILLKVSDIDAQWDPIMTCVKNVKISWRIHIQCTRLEILSTHLFKFLVLMIRLLWNKLNHQKLKRPIKKRIKKTSACLKFHLSRFLNQLLTKNLSNNQWKSPSKKISKKLSTWSSLTTPRWTRRWEPRWSNSWIWAFLTSTLTWLLCLLLQVFWTLLALKLCSKWFRMNELETLLKNTC